MYNEIDCFQDIIDVRDVIGRFEELEDENEPRQGTEVAEDDMPEFEEYLRMKVLLEELQGMGGDEQWRGDWYPISLIRDSYFEEAMDELLEDIGDIPRNLSPYLTIKVDYKALQMDYSSVDFTGVTYWYR